MPGKKCVTAGQHAERRDRCDECLAARLTTPGPLASSGVGPPAWFPIPAPIEEPPPVWAGEGFMPIDPSAYARDWDAFLEREPEAPPFPAPVVTSQDGGEVPDKIAVRRVVSAAEGAGWTAVLTYACGHVPHATTGRPSDNPKDSIAVRLSRGQEVAFAVYTNTSRSTWSWGTMYVNRFRKADITEFEEALR